MQDYTVKRIDSCALNNNATPYGVEKAYAFYAIIMRHPTGS